MKWINIAGISIAISLLHSGALLGSEGEDSESLQLISMVEEENEARQAKRAISFGNTLYLLGTVYPDSKSGELFRELFKVNRKVAIKISECWLLRIESEYQETIDNRFESMSEEKKFEKMGRAEISARIFVHVNDQSQIARDAYLLEHFEELEGMMKSASR